MTMLVDNSGMMEVYESLYKVSAFILPLRVNFKTFFRLIPTFYELKRLHYPYINCFIEIQEFEKYFITSVDLQFITILKRGFIHSFIHAVTFEVDYNLPNITDCYI